MLKSVQADIMANQTKLCGCLLHCHLRLRLREKVEKTLNKVVLLALFLIIEKSNDVSSVCKLNFLYYKLQTPLFIYINKIYILTDYITPD